MLFMIDKSTSFNPIFIELNDEFVMNSATVKNINSYLLYHVTIPIVLNYLFILILELIFSIFFTIFNVKIPYFLKHTISLTIYQ